MTVIRELQTVFVASIEMLANQSLQATPNGAPERIRSASIAVSHETTQ